MSDSAHRAPAEQRRRQAIMWTVVGAIVVIALVLLAFCAGTGGDPEAQIPPPAQTTTKSAPGSGPTSGSTSPGSGSSQGVTSPPGGNPGGQPITSGPGAPASVSAKAPSSRSATPRTKSPTPVAPRDGADTGGGSSLTGESTIFIGLGVVTLLAAMAAAVLATRPRRRIEP